MIRIGYIAGLAFAAGLVSGGAITHKLMSGAAAQTELKGVRQADTSARKVRTHQREVATEFEAVREHIDTDTKEAGDGLQKYLDARPDLRGIDLGDEWVCLVAQADGKPCRPATRVADGAVPGPAASADQAGAGATGVPVQPAAVPPVSGTSGRAGARRETGSN